METNQPTKPTKQKEYICLHPLVDDGAEELKISIVSAGPKYRLLVDLQQARAVTVTSQGTIGPQHVSGKDNTVLELDPKD